MRTRQSQFYTRFPRYSSEEEFIYSRRIDRGLDVVFFWITIGAILYFIIMLLLWGVK